MRRLLLCCSIVLSFIIIGSIASAQCSVVDSLDGVQLSASYTVTPTDAFRIVRKISGSIASGGVSNFGWNDSSSNQIISSSVGTTDAFGKLQWSPCASGACQDGHIY